MSKESDAMDWIVVERYGLAELEKVSIGTSFLSCLACDSSRC